MKPWPETFTVRDAKVSKITFVHGCNQRYNYQFLQWNTIKPFLQTRQLGLGSTTCSISTVDQPYMAEVTKDFKCDNQARLKVWIEYQEAEKLCSIMTVDVTKKWSHWKGFQIATAEA